MNRNEFGDALQLNNNLLINEKVNHVALIKPYILVFQWQDDP